ncbi:MAG: hypothetical protein NWE98_00380 [Candidatus Bathyarchaeota archaeon]|nr:hypothetical protein [Candidatus Bathyarchaeota archaeon]
MPNSITEYGEIATENLTETGRCACGAVTEIGELIFNAEAPATFKQVTDQLNLSDSIFLNKPDLWILDDVAATDELIVSKMLMLSEEVGAIETVEQRIGAKPKTRLFLILGDLAIELRGS